MAVFSAMLVGTVCGVAVLGTTLISLARFHLHHHIMAALKNIIMTITIISLAWFHQHHHNHHPIMIETKTAFTNTFMSITINTW